MTRVEALQAEADKLSPADRTRLLEHLVARLEQDPEIEAAWDDLAAERQDDLTAARVVAVPAEDALARLRARFPG
jgi:putative addiction module component (TIGR02574 family)